MRDDDQKQVARKFIFLAKHVAFRGVGDIGGFREDEALVSIWIDMESAFLGYFDL